MDKKKLSAFLLLLLVLIPIVFAVVIEIYDTSMNDVSKINGISKADIAYINGLEVEPTPTEYNSTVVSTEIVNWMNMNSGEMDTFISYMVAQNMTEVTLRWDVLREGDWKDGTANSGWVTTCESYITKFNNSDIEVNIDLHTWYTTWSTYWVDDASNSAYWRGVYIDFIEDIMAEFTDEQVKAWMVFNEITEFSHTSESEDAFIVEAVETAQGLTANPVGIRFGGGYSPWSSPAYYGASVGSVVDFMAINSYWDPDDPETTIWGCSETDIQNTITEAESAGKEVWITEFGASNSNENEQADYINDWVIYANDNNITRIYGWVSQPENGGGLTYNLWDGYTPRPAWYQLANP